MKRILFIILLTIPFLGFGQGWEKTFGKNSTNCRSSCVQETTDGGYIIIGKYTEEFGNQNTRIWLIKTNSSGDTIWTNNYDGSWGNSVEQTTDGGYIILGGSGDTTKLIKTDSLGTPLWNKNYYLSFYDNNSNVIQTFDGGYIFTSDHHIIKTNPQGDSIWSKNTYPLSNGSIRETLDSGFVMVGNYDESGVTNDYSYLKKLDVNGNIEWNKIIDEIRCSDVYETYDSCYILMGSQSLGSFPGLGYFIKTNNQGDTLWTRSYPYSGSGYWLKGSIYPTNDGGYIICGHTNNSNGGDILLIKLDINGNQQWTQTYGGLNEEYGNHIHQTSDNGFIISGYTESFGQFNVFYIIKTNSQGTITSTFNISTQSSKRKLEKIVDILGRETKPQTNTPFIEIYDDGSTEKKIVIE